MAEIDTAREFLTYCPETGEFRWKKSPASRAKVGNIAGYNHHSGYRAIELRGVIYQAHRLAWLMTYGSLKTPEIDHINGIRNDNRISNLREATRSQNQHNRKIWKKGTSSNLKGVSLHKLSGKWSATIQCDNKRKHLGLFMSAMEAHEAYTAESDRLHGDFARVSCLSVP